MMPPPPPGMAALFDWIVWLVIIGLFVVGLLLLVKYISREFNVSTGFAAGREEELERTMRELLEEIRLLRREIEEFRRELRG